MVEEIYIIGIGGLPLFYFNKKEEEGIDVTADEPMLRAGLFTAISTFAAELKDQLRFVGLEKRSYLLNKTKDLLLIFGTEGELTGNERKKVEDQLTAASESVGNFVTENKIDTRFVLPSIQEEIINYAKRYFLTEQIIEGDIELDTSEIKRRVQQLVFRTVGYKPGQCNIGPAERQRRIGLGVSILLLSVIAFMAMVQLGLPPEFRLLLIFPLFGAFNGIYQYFFRFCVTTAFKRSYSFTA
ncbi:MAG: hypothetical protein ACFFC7_14825 [Candidatus Hermodarchaeota archaeon]